MFRHTPESICAARDELWPTGETVVNKRGEINQQAVFSFMEKIANYIYPQKLSKIFLDESPYFQSGRLFFAKQLFLHEKSSYAADVFFARNKLWESANGDSSERNEDTVARFRVEIERFIQPQTLADIVDDRNFSSGRLLAVRRLFKAEVHASASAPPASSAASGSSGAAEPMSLSEIAAFIVSERDRLFASAIRQSRSRSLKEILTRFFQNVIEAIHEKDGSVRAILQDETAKGILNQSSKLKLFVDILSEAFKPTADEDQRVRRYVEDAEARGVGLLTELGICAEGGASAARRAAHNIARKQHPDKNAGVAGEQLAGALEVLALVKDGVLDECIAAWKEKKQAGLGLGR